MTLDNINDLKIAVLSIPDKEYGDFKRKTITYLNRYAEKLDKLSEDQQKQLHFMKWYIQYYPNQDTQSTKLWTLQQIDKLH